MTSLANYVPATYRLPQVSVIRTGILQPVIINGVDKWLARNWSGHARVMNDMLLYHIVR